MIFVSSSFSTPASLGFSMPAEWHAHEGTWLSWPKNPLTFPPRLIGAVEELFSRMAVALSEHEKVNLLVDDEKTKEDVDRRLARAGANDSNLQLHLIPSADVWIRDFGPTFLLHKKTGKKACVKWEFNAWGNKYDDILPDNETGEEVARTLEKRGVHVFRPGIVMEGGSFDADGGGRLLTTKQCLLNKNRNPALNQSHISQYLRDYLGVSDIIWLSSGIEGDDTDGHVDDFARFFGEGKVLCNFSENRNDPNARVLEENEALLRSQPGLREIVRLPMPKPLVDEGENRRLPASYANFYVANKVVLVPSFGDAKDKEAAGLLASCFGGREILPLPARELVYGYGGIHCVTQQEPKEG
ncbi:MAG: agmatine deiminase family protein [Candidatus Micrarchaeota archaeon]